LKYIKIGDSSPPEYLLGKRIFGKLCYGVESSGPPYLVYLKTGDALIRRIGFVPFRPIEIVDDSMVLLTFLRFLLQKVPDCMKHFYVGDFGAIANGDEAVLRFVKGALRAPLNPPIHKHL
jgi:hypothetical protein